jgi:CO dehydrogenase nickel-insertion accessory protein CooC1
MSRAGHDGKRLVATCGKGGTGKTVSVALMARALSEAPGTGKLLLIDADPAMGASALGVKVDEPRERFGEDHPTARREAEARSSPST